MKDCYVAFRKDNGEFFGGKSSGNHIGYSKLAHLKAAMTYAQVSHEKYEFVKLSIDERYVPILTKL